MDIEKMIGKCDTGLKTSPQTNKRANADYRTTIKGQHSSVLNVKDYYHPSLPSHTGKASGNMDFNSTSHPLYPQVNGLETTDCKKTVEKDEQTDP